MASNHLWKSTVLLAITGGCATHPPPAAPASSGNPVAATTQTDMKDQPFMFGEANLPKAFPAPGPVGKVIVKQYPASRAAITGGDNQNRMFQPLFNHIKKHDIPMSAPVEITWSDPQSQGAETKPVTMAFVYGDPSVGSPGPDGAVQVIDVPAQVYLSVGMRGSYDQAHLLDGLKQLHAWLESHPGEYKVIGPPRYLAYNSPFVPWFMRYGEVQLPLERVRNQ